MIPWGHEKESSCCSEDSSCNNEDLSSLDDVTTTLENTIKILEDKIVLLNESLLESKANTINSINRIRKDNEKNIKNTENNIIVDFLKIIDFFNTGLNYAKTLDNSDVKNLVIGFQMVQNQLEEFLSSKKIKMKLVNLKLCLYKSN